jgi:hypothetical protein
VGGPGTASEIALALKSDKYIVLFNSSKESSKTAAIKDG